jgi:hypothetical protein
MCNTLDAYQVFIVSVITFVGQLIELPEDFQATEDKAIQLLFPGPRHWINGDTLKTMKSLHMPKEFYDAHINSLAAKAPVARFENSSNGGLQVERRCIALLQVMNTPDNVIRVGRNSRWLQSNMLFNLQSSLKELRAVETKLGVEVSLLGIDGHPEQARQNWQARAANLFKAVRSYSFHIHARRKFDKWNIPTLPGHRLMRWQRGLKTLKDLVPPRVIACCYRTSFSGWLTSRRMQGKDGCILNCRDQEDSIAHYVLCPNFHRLCERFLQLSRPLPNNCLEEFVGINSDKHPAKVALRAIGVYALYRCHNAVRHNTLFRRDVADGFRGFIREAVRGHGPASSILSCAGKRTRDT